MPKYLIQANYVGEGLKGLLKEGGSSRRATIEKLLGSVGGRVEAFYYAFGDTDAFVIVDLPDNVTAAALFIDHQCHCGRHRQDHGSSNPGGNRRRGEEESLVSAAGTVICTDCMLKAK